MLPTHADLSSTFDGYDIRTIPGDLPADITDPAAQQVLTDVGLPEEVTRYLLLSSIDEGMRTVNDMYQSHGGSPPPDKFAGLYLIGHCGDEIVCLNGSSGQVFVTTDGAQGIRMLNTGLDKFVEFLYRLQQEIATINESTTDEEVDRMKLRILRTFQDIDSGAIEKSGEVWRETIEGVIVELD